MNELMKVEVGSAFSRRSIASLLAEAAGDLEPVSATARLEAELLLSFVAGIGRGTVLAFPERVLDAELTESFHVAIQRRTRGEPHAYITGEREFYSLPLNVTPDVLVPRGDTETLVDAVLHHLDAAPRSTVLDVGTGSGAIALAVKHQRPAVRVTAVDCDAAALRIAGANALRLGLDVRCVESNWFSALAGERFDLIVSNPPYVRSDDPHFAGSLRFEPRLALDGGRDGLDAYRAVFARAGQYLVPGGLILFEHGYDQRASVLELGVAHAFEPVALLDDLSGMPRVAIFGAPRI